MRRDSPYLQLKNYAADRVRSESGVIIVLTAVIVAAVFLLIVLVGYNTAKVRAAAAELRIVTDEECRHAASFLPVIARAVSLDNTPGGIETAITSKLTKSKLTELNIVAPSVPLGNEEGGDLIGNPSSEGQSVDDCNTFGPAGSISLPCGSANNCRLITNVCGQGVEGILARFPKMFNNLYNAGNTIACETTATVSTLFSSPKTIRTSAAFSVWLRGPNPDLLFPENGSTRVENEGLLLAVSTHMVTDRLKGYMRIDGSEGAQFSSFAPVATGFLTKTQNQPNDSTASYLPIKVVKPPLLLTMGMNMDWPNRKEDFLVACINRPVWVRDTILSTFTALASHHGQLLNQTEIVHVGTEATKGTSAENGSGAGTAGVTGNGTTAGADYAAPAEIVSPGNPLVPVSSSYGGSQPGYQMPYVVYDAAGLKGISADGQKQINPLSSHVDTPEPQQPHQSLVAGQLRYCYQYYGEEGTSKVYNLIPAPMQIEANRDLDPPTYTGQFNKSLWYTEQSYRTTTDSTLDQACPFTPTGPCGDLDVHTRRLSAVEIMRALGTTQACPFDDVGTGDVCAKRINDPEGAIGTKGEHLYPDLVSLLQYWLRGTDANAIAPPGMIQSLTSPRLADFLGREERKDPLLLVLSKWDTTQFVNIQDLVGGVNSAVRPITVVYIPSDLKSQSTWNLLAQAFKAKVVGDTTRTGSNTMYYVGPDSPMQPCGDPSIPVDEGRFAEYWKCLMANGGPSYTTNAEKIGSDIFGGMLTIKRRF